MNPMMLIIKSLESRTKIAAMNQNINQSLD